MSEDKKEIEETTETPIEETQESVSEEVEETDDTPTIEDYNLEKQKRIEAEKRAKTFEAQKEHYRKKAEEKKLETASNKPNNTVSRDEVITLTRLAQTHKPEVLEEARIISEAKGITLEEALQYPTIVAFEQSIKKKEKSDDASLPASGQPSIASDFKPGMSEEEHRKMWEKYNK